MRLLAVDPLEVPRLEEGIPVSTKVKWECGSIFAQTWEEARQAWVQSNAIMEELLNWQREQRRSIQVVSTLQDIGCFVQMHSIALSAPLGQE
jgi:hypothetical protein